MSQDNLKRDDEEDDVGEDDVGDNLVTLTDDEGNETEFEILGLIEVGGEDFALLTPTEVEDEDADTEIFIFYYEADEDGTEVFRDVEDQATFDKVRAEAERLFQELDDED